MPVIGRVKRKPKTLVYVDAEGLIHERPATGGRKKAKPKPKRTTNAAAKGKPKSYLVDQLLTRIVRAETQGDPLQTNGNLSVTERALVSRGLAHAERMGHMRWEWTSTAKGRAHESETD